MNGLLRGLLPDGVFGCEVQDTGQTVAIDEAEAALVAGAGPVRRRDFTLGRHCAHAALAAAGGAGTIWRAAHGTPIWPQGFMGSITHTKGYAAAIAARHGRHAGLGIDAEQVGRIGEDLFARLFDAREQAWLGGCGAAIPAMATLLFAAKEAAFKASHPPAGRALVFTDIAVTVTGPGSFTVPGGQGRYGIAWGLAVALVMAG